MQGLQNDNYPQGRQRDMSEGFSDSLAGRRGSLNAGGSLWQACMDQLAQELPEQQFNTWIKPLAAKVSDDFSKVTLYVANRFKLDWVRAQYAGRIAATLEKLYGQPVQLELALAQRESPAKPYVARPSRDDSGG
jgi:chromosomal replication initiator protein